MSVSADAGLMGSAVGSSIWLIGVGVAARPSRRVAVSPGKASGRATVATAEEATASEMPL